MQSLYERIRWAWHDAADQFDSMTGFLNAMQCNGVAQRCNVKRTESIHGAEPMPSGMVSPGRGRYDAFDVDAPYVHGDEGSDQGRGLESGHGDMNDPCTTARSTQSVEEAEHDVCHEEREREKARLQKLLKDFAKEAVAGIAVNLVNLRTGRKPPYLFQMDKHLFMCSLRPKDGSAAEFPIQDFQMTDLVGISKGHDLLQRWPCLGREVTGCVGLDLDPDDRSMLLHFDDTYERDKFYTSMQVMLLSVGIQQSR